MLGLLILGIIAVYVAFWVFIARRLKRRWAKVAVAVVAILVPTWDLIPQEMRFRKLCETEAGYHFHAEPVVVEGFYAPSMGEGGARRFVENTGYRYIESLGAYKGHAGQLLRVELGPDGKSTKTKIEQVTSRYELSDFSEGRGWGTFVAGQRVIDRQTGEVLAYEASAYQGATGLFSTRLFRGFSASGDPCHGGGRDREPIPDGILLPATETNQPEN